MQRLYDTCDLRVHPRPPFTFPLHVPHAGHEETAKVEKPDAEHFLLALVLLLYEPHHKCLFRRVPVRRKSSLRQRDALIGCALVFFVYHPHYQLLTMTHYPQISAPRYLTWVFIRPFCCQHRHPLLILYRVLCVVHHPAEQPPVFALDPLGCASQYIRVEPIHPHPFCHAAASE